MIDDVVKMLDTGARNLRSNKNPTSQDAAAYLSLVRQFEQQGEDLSHYREIGEEANRRITRKNTPWYIKLWENVKKIIDYKVF